MCNWNSDMQATAGYRNLLNISADRAGEWQLTTTVLRRDLGRDFILSESADADCTEDYKQESMYL